MSSGWKHYLPGLALFVVTAICTTHAANLITNVCFQGKGTGGFSPGWVHSGSAEVVATFPDPNCNPPSPYEAQLGHSQGDFYQVLTTVPGKEYFIRFDLALQGSVAPYQNAFTVAAENGSTVLFSESLENFPANFPWVRISFLFAAVSTNTRLDFSGYARTGYWYVDYPHLPAPEPGTLVTLATGLAVVAGASQLRMRAGWSGRDCCSRLPVTTSDPLG